MRRRTIRIYHGGDSGRTMVSSALSTCPAGTLVAHQEVRIPEHGPTSPAPELPTVGVEEEFLLLEPDTGTVAPLAAEVIRDCAAPSRVAAESMTYMVETRTSVCRTLEDVGRDLRLARELVATAAADRGLVAVPSGVSPFHTPAAPLLTGENRYQELARRFPFAMRTSGTCACHVHVGVPDRRAGVQALLRLRRWLPALVALTAGSPIWLGCDSGWASERLRLVSRWPTAQPAPPVTTEEQYDEAVHLTVTRGEALDVRNVYFFARLSPRYPTVEVRLADVLLTVDETLGYAGLVRALVATAVDDWLHDRPAPTVPQPSLRRSCLRAARLGPRADDLDPLAGGPVTTWAVADTMATTVGARLRAHGDHERVQAALARARATGGGAEQRRRLFRVADSPRDYLTALAAAMTSRSDEPA